MSEKPIPPKKERVCLAPSFIIAIILFIITSLIIISISIESKALALYNSDLAEYNQIVANHEKELTKYSKEVLSYIRSIAPSYDIDDIGTIPVEVTVSEYRDKGSRPIGSEFSYCYYINDYNLTSKKTIRLSIFREVTFQTIIIEDDQSSDDIGTKTDSVPLSFLDIISGYQLEQEVRVRENFGTNAGNVAIFHVTYTIKPKQTIKLSTSQKKAFPEYPILPNKPNKNDYSIGFWEVIRNYSDVKLYIGIAFIVWVSYAYYTPRLRYNRALDKYKKELEEYTSIRNEIINTLSGKTIREVVGVPPSVFFTNEDLPYTKGDNEKFGKYTLYITPSGNRYHRDKACRKTAFPIHMFMVSHQYSPCSICAKDFIIQKPTWYTDYLDLKKKCKQYEIPDE